MLRDAPEGASSPVPKRSRPARQGNARQFHSPMRLARAQQPNVRIAPVNLRSSRLELRYAAW